MEVIRTILFESHQEAGGDDLMDARRGGGRVQHSVEQLAAYAAFG
jgi:hypothetical protein